METTFNEITEISGCILEAFMKNLYLFIPQFFVWRKLNCKYNSRSKAIFYIYMHFCDETQSSFV